MTTAKKAAKPQAHPQPMTTRERELMQALLAAEQKHATLAAAFETVNDNVALLNAELQDTRLELAATQELLNGCLSPEADAKHSPAANAVRRVLSSMLRNMGWLDPEMARELRYRNERLIAQNETLRVQAVADALVAAVNGANAKQGQARG